MGWQGRGRLGQNGPDQLEVGRQRPQPLYCKVRNAQCHGNPPAFPWRIQVNAILPAAFTMTALSRREKTDWWQEEHHTPLCNRPYTKETFIYWRAAPLSQAGIPIITYSVRQWAGQTATGGIHVSGPQSIMTTIAKYQPIITNACDSILGK